MAELIPNKPLITKTPILELDGLKAGIYRVQLRVIDEAGNVSRPDVATVEVSFQRRLPDVPIEINPLPPFRSPGTTAK